MPGRCGIAPGGAGLICVNALPAAMGCTAAQQTGRGNQMSSTEIFYLAVVLATFAGFSATLAISSARWERHKSKRAEAGE